ncbi:rhythmically expressed gene 5 protein [Phlebotomus argentipes]|uniref:rhythmically expressed gene 5 protein n=1 Tax=Phlebotomus argentipes TaxID=94469 RepID=UPI002892BF4A|nr:rhythmically expressed gene 5 protein [Phlebotomus argentipes]
MANRMLVYTLTFATVIVACSGSAIPMWEYLSRGEKMSHLYSMFAKQVSSYCKTNRDLVSKPQCKRELLTHGLEMLQKMPESHLDSMDPYQRGANDIIWDSMMEGHSSKPQKKETSTASPIMLPEGGQYAKNPLFDGLEPAVKKPTTHQDYAMGMDSDVAYQNYRLPEASSDVFYSDPTNYLAQEAPTNLRPLYANPSGVSESNYLTGPMVVRVMPDGSPVAEDRHRRLPKDDDRDEMTIGRARLPTLDQIARSFSTTQNRIDERAEVAATQPTATFRHYPTYRTIRRNGGVVTFY